MYINIYVYIYKQIRYTICIYIYINNIYYCICINSSIYLVTDKLAQVVNIRVFDILLPGKVFVSIPDKVLRIGILTTCILSGTTCILSGSEIIQRHIYVYVYIYIYIHRCVPIYMPTYKYAYIYILIYT